MKCSNTSTGFYPLFLSFVSTLFLALRRFFNISKVTIFGNEVVLGPPLQRFGHERPFVNLIEVDELHYNTARALSKTEMQRCVSALISNTPLSSTIEGAVQLFVFTTDEEGSLTTISLEKTHAFSILTARGHLLEHHYFEKQNALAFQKVPSLSMPISGPLDLDDIRLLHFAGTGERGLPLKSTIYEFNAGTWASKDWSWKKNIPLRIALLQDQDRNWGAPTLGLYGDEIYLAFLNETGSYCGGNRDCPKGDDDTCGSPPGGPDKVCGAIGVGGDIFVDISRAFGKRGIVPSVPIDYVLLRSLRKDFLVNYKKGRDYVSYYYIAALFAKLDRSLLEKYVQAIPHLDKAIRELLSGADETVIVTTPLRDSMLDIINDHRDVQDAAFQEILDIVEKDLRYWHGMTKGQLIDALRQ